MALDLKQKIEDTRNATKIYVTDKTGAYNASTNAGGWGSPNPELNQYALVSIGVMKHSEGDKDVVPVTSNVSFNENANNTYETVFTFTYLGDGVHEFYLFALPVSEDGVNTLDGHTLVEGEYFYMNGVIYRIVSGTATVVEDYKAMIDDATVTQGKCDKLYVSKLKIKRNDLYLDYTEARGSFVADDPKFLKTLELSEDIRGVINTFLSGLLVDAENQIETLLDLYDVG